MIVAGGKAHRLESLLARSLMALATACGLMLANPASAADLQVSPTTLFVSAERSADGLTLRNTGDKPLHAQVRVYEWQQQDGEDRLLPTRAIAASPPLLELPAGGQQLVRIVRLTAPPNATEASYRIIVDELPAQTDNATPASQPAGSTMSTSIQILLKYSVPVFLLPPKQIVLQPILHTRLVTAEGVRYIDIRNDGNSHAQIADLALLQGEQRVSIAPGLSGYLLPGKQRQWRLPENLALSGEVAIAARVNGEIAERTLAPVTVDR